MQVQMKSCSRAPLAKPSMCHKKQKLLIRIPPLEFVRDVDVVLASPARYVNSALGY